MKKVDEGVELFDDIWEKVYTAEQQNQKEKFEMDLKKEIKKLQRHRDQIKTWIGGTEVKDKEPLLEARRLIESKMEQFKICEKETKTKAYSKEGLLRDDKLDPEEEAKLNTTTWCQEYIERFMQEVEEKDFEIEKLSTGKGKKSQKHRMEALQKYVQQHKFHISKLEGIIRLVNNDVLSVDTVEPLKDDLDYYLDSYEDEDYAQAYDEEYFYESLGLDELDVVNVDRLNQPTKKADDATSTSSRSGSKSKGSSKKSSVSMVIPLTIGRARSSKEKAKDEEKAAAATPTKIGRASSTASSGSKSDSTPAPPPVKASTPTPNTTPSQPGTSMAAILKRESEQQEKERQQKVCINNDRSCRLTSFILTYLADPTRTTGTSASRTVAGATGAATASATRGPTPTGSSATAKGTSGTRSSPAPKTRGSGGATTVRSCTEATRTASRGC